MVVGHAQEVVACILEPLAIGGRGSEGILVGAVLGAFSAVAEGAFQIAYCEVGPMKNVFDLLEEVGSVLWREQGVGVGGAHHDVACQRDGDGVVRSSIAGCTAASYGYG